MALDAGAVPEALPGGVARADFNTMRAIINGSFPLQTVDIGLLQITAALLGALSVETTKIDNLAVTVGKLAADAVETAKIKNLNVTPGKASLGFGRYVERLTGDSDFAIGDFTVDTAWHVDGLNLSAIVPAGAVAVVLEVLTRSAAADKLVQFRRDAVNDSNRVYIKTQVANIYPPAAHFVLPVDSNRLVDYYVQVAIAVLEVTVIGWFT